MRDGRLSGALRAYTKEAAALLAAETAAGAEVPFELAAEPGRRGTPLYCYRPLTGRFIAERDELLARLPCAPAALGALARIPRVPEPAGELRAFLAAALGDAPGFGFAADRFAAAYAELERRLYDGQSRATVFVPVLGLELESAELPLPGGLSLVAAEALDGAPGEAAGVLAVFERPERPGEPAAAGLARAAFRGLATALRLFDRPAPALGPVAWSRVDDGAWRLVPSGGAGQPRGVLRIPAAQEDELRAFVSLLSRRTPRDGELAWALHRYELGCAQVAVADLLSDHLLALRALLEPEGTASGRLPPRLAALCAERPDRPALAERVARAGQLERALVTGLAPPVRDPAALTLELAGHLRALLRDALCGHLPPDLRALADEILAEETAEAALTP